MRDRRAADSLAAVGGHLGVSHTTLSRIERGTHRPSAETARALAAWLGWTIEQVLDAAEAPIDSGPD